MEVFWLNKKPVITLKSGSSIRRKLNSLLIGLQTRLKTSRVFGYPRHLILDLVNICGLNCPICPQGRKEIPRSPAQMSEFLFRQIMSELGPYLYTLTLTNWGEPLRHPDVLRLIEIARKYPAYIGFSSNLQYLPHKMVDGLIMSGVDEIGCSIDGGTEETYLHYRVGGDFSLALDNLKLLVKRKRELGVGSLKIRWQVLLNRYTEPEIPLITRMAEQIGVDSLVWLPIYVDIARMFTASPQERFAKDKEFLPEDQNLSWYDYSEGRLKIESRFCSKLWDSIVVHPDGAVSPCCAVIKPEDDFGKISCSKDLKKVWNGKSYRRARKLIRNGDTAMREIVCTSCVNSGVLIF
jgi:radical SAM protein with 4Fe4S-binding SPASM domain